MQNIEQELEETKIQTIKNTENIKNTQQGNMSLHKKFSIFTENHFIPLKTNLERVMSLVEKNAEHIQRANSEGAELRDSQKEMKKEITDVKVEITAVKVDMTWLKRNYWIVATASIGALVAGILGVIFK